ncbi:carbamoyltransferase HypF [Clostridium acetireducens DSM 10703]|uniref:Carbamoyltransferase HypF n=1 Tax=Clostridium acetireducens DSM 10703 TaxID=1121290 RepID=A0A1E8F110_9CLOT|nr:carbamoyltransferase HypF [Clostridium acetireducens]OFI07120.1 carbamoyltransferase HypF [Clostridium acetireducens DSM 10703]
MKDNLEEYEVYILDNRSKVYSCRKCKLSILNSLGSKLNCSDEIKKVAELIKQGKIIAVKGVGGFHLVCNGENEKTIDLLRKKKKRPKKPFAVMMRNIQIVNKYCSVNKLEENILTGNNHPIVLLKKKNNLLPEVLAPDINQLGVMLPYNDIYNLLLNQGFNCLVVTSANISGFPTIYKYNEALDKLKNVADYYLIHDKPIKIPIDDSVVKIISKEERVFRNGRAYAPLTFEFYGERDILACGSHLKNTFCLGKKGLGVLSQYIGDMENIESQHNFSLNLEYLKRKYNIKPKIIAYDMHPNFWSKDYVNKYNCKNVPIYHHHAHIASCMAENKEEYKVIGIAYDGVGFGSDKNIWGGEFLICDYKDFKRLAHINYVKMPGGDLSCKEPYRMALSYLYKIFGDDLYNKIPKDFYRKDSDILIAMMKNNINSPKCSSMGRLFDAVSSLLGFKGVMSYEGQAALILENMAYNFFTDHVYKYSFYRKEEGFIINTDEIIKGILEDLKYKKDKGYIARKFHNTIINFSCSMAIKLRKIYGINKVTLSGGVFQNEIILEGIYKGLKKEDFQVLTHKKIPCNDSGISFGQLFIANKQDF